MPIKSDLISRGKQCCSNNTEIDSAQNHVIDHSWSVITILIIIMLIIIVMIIIIVILIVIDLYIIIKDKDNDNDDENNAQNKDKKNIWKNRVHVNDHS